MPEIPLGALRESLTIQQPSEAADSQGGAAVTAAGATVATVMGAVIATAGSGAEYLQGNAVRSHVPYIIELVYRADITPGMRVLWTPYLGSQKTLQILAVSPVGGRVDRLVLECAEVA